MLRFVADENFNYDIVRGLWRRQPDLDVIRTQDTEYYRSKDPRLLAWVASQQRILLTHDVRTITKYAYERVRSGLPMPGVFEIKRRSPMAKVIEDILLLAEASYEGEYEGVVVYIPL